MERKAVPGNLGAVQVGAALDGEKDDDKEDEADDKEAFPVPLERTDQRATSPGVREIALGIPANNLERFNNEEPETMGVDDNITTAELVDPEQEKSQLKASIETEVKKYVANNTSEAQAWNLDEEERLRAKRRKRRMLIYFATAAVLAAAIVIAVVFSVRKLVDESNDTEPTMAPTEVPTAAPTLRRFAVRSNLEDLLEMDGDDSIVFDDPQSPQYRALTWFTEVDVERTQFPLESSEGDDDDDDDASPSDVFLDRYASVVLAYGTEFWNWNDAENWLNPDVSICEWSGITCNDEGRPAVLDLAQRGLKGFLPTEVGLLGSLDFLYLFSNELSGPLPKELGNLDDVDVSWNRWLTSFPNVHLNRISQPWYLPSVFCLQFFYLQDNKFNGTIPEELSGLLDADEVFLFDNQLTGKIPDAFGGLVDLINLYLHDNQLSGAIPSSLGRLKRMQRLYLHNNALGGEIPHQLNGIVSLQRLLIHNNQLIGQIPPELGAGFVGLSELQLHENLLTGVMPPEICALRPADPDSDTADLVVNSDALQVLTADCMQVNCTCCSQCF